MKNAESVKARLKNIAKEKKIESANKISQISIPFLSPLKEANSVAKKNKSIIKSIFKIKKHIDNWYK